jgi:serine/threonine-protein kinase
MTELDEQQERAQAVREALIGKTIAGRYVLRALVGHGGMGAVYEAEHLGLGKRVAIKFIDPEFATDERVLARFAREARAMSSIESAHIVTVFDAGTEEGRPYLVMELLRGEDLGQRLRRTVRVPVAEAMHVIAQVLKGLAKAHAAGIVHRDLKPDNVFLVKSDTDPLFAKIVDFGVSKIERPRDKTSPLALTGRGTVLGTPFYMSPEQAQAMPDVDVRADIYSVGAILFECLSGRPPHTGETYEQIILSICMRDAPDLRAIDPTLSPAVAGFVARALSRERTDRYGSAERMLAALHEIAPEEKTRVPLDAGAPDTLMSPGVLFPAQHKGPPASSKSPLGTETRIAGSGSNPGEGGSGVIPGTIMTPAPPPGRSDRTTVDGARSFASEPSVPIVPAANARPAARSMGTDAALSAAGISSRRKSRSLTSIVATAVIATLMGIGMALAVIMLLDKKASNTTAASPSTSAHARPPTITSGIAAGGPSGTASGASSEAAPALDPSAAPSATSSTSSASPPSASPAPATTAKSPSGKPAQAAGRGGAKPAGTKPAGTKPLDISRDLN